MRPPNSSQDGIQGEGDRVSARHYNKDLREFVEEGKVEDAAEAKAKRGPRGKGVSVDELIAKGRSVVERVRPYLERASRKLRERFGRK